MDWFNQDPTLFEPLNAVAPIIVAKFDREWPMTFYRLPQELREQVFDY